MLGEIFVGKTNIVRNLFNEEFEELESTIGVEFGIYSSKDVDPEEKTKRVDFQVWDTCIFLTKLVPRDITQ